MSPRSPRYQLVPGDRYNITLGVLAAFALAGCKDLPPRWTHRFVRWSLNAYTNWNLAFVLLRYALGQTQWDPFLLTNSVGIFLGFRTAFVQGIDENMRRKLRHLGLNLPRWLFLTLDHLCHTLPPALLLSGLLRRRQRVHQMNSVYCLVLSSWFAFRQQAKLDSSTLYVPHPWKRAWTAIGVGALATPLLVNAAIDGQRRRVISLLLAMAAPYLCARMDPTLRNKYHLDYLAAEVGRAREKHTKAAGAKGAPGMPRAASEAPLLWRGSDGNLKVGGGGGASAGATSPAPQADTATTAGPVGA